MAVLATVGVGVSMAVIAVAAHLLLGISWQLAFLLGAIVSPTDAAAVFSILRVLPLPRRVVSLLEAESGFNDAPHGHRGADAEHHAAGDQPGPRHRRGGLRAGGRLGDRPDQPACWER